VCRHARQRYRCWIGLKLRPGVRDTGHITWSEQYPLCADLVHGGRYAGQGASETREHILDDAIAEAQVVIEMPVGIDHDFMHMRFDHIDDVLHERLVLQDQHSLVYATHALTTSASKDDGGDLVRRDRHFSCSTSGLKIQS
jgi:hypothetical protein